MRSDRENLATDAAGFFGFDFPAFACARGFCHHWESLDDDARADVIAKIQIAYGFTATGEFHEEMIDVLGQVRPRTCRSDRAMLGAGKWQVDELLFTIDIALTSDAMSANQFVGVVDSCLDGIGRVCGISAKLTDDRRNAHVIIGVGRGRRSHFDGPGGVLAWAEFPPSGAMTAQRRLMFDADEDWTHHDDPVKAGRRIMVPATLRHELGHNLGLDHDQDPRPALMDPTYDPGVRDYLSTDTARLQRLYGPPKHGERPTPSPQQPSIDDDSGSPNLTTVVAHFADGTRTRFVPQEVSR